MVGLIAVLAGALGLALRGGEGGAALTGASRTVAGVFQAARAQAVLLGTEARVIIANDPSDPDRYLRALAIVHRDPENPNLWRSNGDVVTLPKGLYIIPPSYSGPAPKRSSGPSLTMGFSQGFPFREAAESGGSGWLAYAYDAQGVTAQAGAKVVVGAGRLSDAGAAVEFNGEQVAGFALARLGGLIHARSPEDL